MDAPVLQSIIHLYYSYRNVFTFSYHVLTGKRLLQKACGNDTGQGGGGEGGGGGGGNVGLGSREPESPSNTSPPDTADIKNLVLQNLEAIHTSQQHLLQLWHQKKLKLDQCFQLRLFEQDCEKVCLIIIILLLVYFNIFILDVRLDLPQSRCVSVKLRRNRSHLPIS